MVSGSAWKTTLTSGTAGQSRPTLTRQTPGPATSDPATAA